MLENEDDLQDNLTDPAPPLDIHPVPVVEPIATEAKDGIDITVMDETRETAVPASSETVTKPLAFKVKLQRKPGSPDERITLFSFVDGDRLDHFDCSSGDEFEKEFDDLSKAHGFMAAALDTGGFTIADDSQVKPRS